MKYKVSYHRYDELARRVMVYSFEASGRSPSHVVEMHSTRHFFEGGSGNFIPIKEIRGVQAKEIEG